MPHLISHRRTYVIKSTEIKKQRSLPSATLRRAVSNDYRHPPLATSPTSGLLRYGWLLNTDHCPLAGPATRRTARRSSRQSSPVASRLLPLRADGPASRPHPHAVVSRHWPLALAPPTLLCTRESAVIAPEGCLLGKRLATSLPAIS